MTPRGPAREEKIPDIGARDHEHEADDDEDRQ